MISIRRYLDSYRRAEPDTGMPADLGFQESLAHLATVLVSEMSPWRRNSRRCAPYRRVFSADGIRRRCEAGVEDSVSRGRRQSADGWRRVAGAGETRAKPPPPRVGAVVSAVRMRPGRRGGFPEPSMKIVRFRRRPGVQRLDAGGFYRDHAVQVLQDAEDDQERLGQQR